MIKCISLSTSYGKFYAHHYQGISKHLLVFIPGLMESKCGLFYIWNEMARFFHNEGHSCLLFDLAGQGDSQLPLSINIWKEQRNEILSTFHDYEIHFIARGIGAILLPHHQMSIAILPSLYEPVAGLLQHIRWKPSPFSSNFLTPAEPNNLLELEKECFHRLGAEAACIGGLQLPTAFLQELPNRLPHQLPDNTKSYEAGLGHPLFDKQSQRDALIRAIANYLFE